MSEWTRGAKIAAGPLEHNQSNSNDRTPDSYQCGLDLFGSLEPFIRTAAPLRIDMVLVGETGTGKDTLARRIHELSGCKGRLIGVNCAAVPDSLAESELFGVMPGAYTGATKARAGYIEASDKGTLYLDEVDSMPLSLQAKLLRVIEGRGVERLGSTEFLPLDLRIIAATQAPLEELVEKGKFRRDLFFRLNVVKMQLPSLRSRPQLIAPLFHKFTRDAARRMNMKVPEDSGAYMGELLSYSWPGNIRELRAAAERLVLGLPPLGEARKDHMQLKDQLRLVERILIQDCLKRHDRCIDSMVGELGIPKRTLYHRMKMLNIQGGEGTVFR
jgi:transcriptional regulator with PAS, ATPase and Fis domain